METNEAKLVNKLIKEYRAGKQSALEQLMLVTYKQLYAISYRYLKDKMLAEDAVSETFVNLIQKIHTISNDKNLIGYLRTIVINKSLDILRRRKKESFFGEEFFNGMADKQNDQSILTAVLALLDSTEREVLLLWQYKYTLSEISLKIDQTVNQVRLLLKKAKQSFAKYYYQLMEINQK